MTDSGGTRTIEPTVIAQLSRTGSLACAIALLVMASAAGTGFCAPANWKPLKTVELVVSVGPGAGHDRTARIVQSIVRDRKLVEAPIVVSNKPGGGHAIAWNHVIKNGEDGYSLLVAAVPLLTNKLIGKSAVTYTDFTSIAQLMNEYVAFAVRKESPLRTGADMVKQLKSNPRGLSIAIGSALGNGPHLALSLAMKQGGVSIRDLRTVIFSGGSEATLAVLGGHVDVLATLASNAHPFVERGEMRALAVSSARRLGGAYAQVPTWKEQGLEAVFTNFRFVLGTKGMDTAQVAFWEPVFSKLTQTSEWKQYLERDNLDPATLGSKESEIFLRDEYVRLQGVMTELGLAK